MQLLQPLWPLIINSLICLFGLGNFFVNKMNPLLVARLKVCLPAGLYSSAAAHLNSSVIKPNVASFGTCILLCLQVSSRKPTNVVEPFYPYREFSNRFRSSAISLFIKTFKNGCNPKRNPCCFRLKTNSFSRASSQKYRGQSKI